jgi:hypothetical protein
MGGYEAADVPDGMECLIGTLTWLPPPPRTRRQSLTQNLAVEWRLINSPDTGMFKATAAHAVGAAPTLSLRVAG